MIAKFYIDLQSGRCPKVASDMLRKLHGLLVKEPELFALLINEQAPFSGFRLFAEEIASLNKVIDFFNANKWVQNNYTLSYINQVPDDFEGQGVILYRIKMSGKKNTENNPELRLAQIERTKNNPYFRMTSKRNGNSFSIKVRHEYIYYSQEDALSASPDGYGLSRQNNKIALPLL